MYDFLGPGIDSRFEDLTLNNKEEEEKNTITLQQGLEGKRFW